MKLYRQYKKAIEKIGQIEIAWFTTFNLDVELLERFLLSAIVGKQSQELKTAEDYEAMNQDLQQIPSIKIWYDYRALNTASPKRTTVDILSVDPVLLFNSTTKDIVFHPKVIFLKGEKGAVLISGSANLSIGAWSNNREAVLFKEITSTKNANEVIDFFERLYQITVMDEEIFRSLRNWAKKLRKTDSGWSFINTFQSNTSFLESLKGTEITIWSPYFSRDANKFFQQLQSKGLKKITLVPDITPSGKIRFIPEILQQLQESDTIQFARDTYSYSEQQPRICHAKVWLTDKMMAVGSWNCSYRATGLNIPLNEQNIEAGILIPVDYTLNIKLKESLKTLRFDTVIGINESELEQDWEEGMNRFSFECKIYANWETFTYSLDGSVSDAYLVTLPHNPGKPIPISKVDGTSFKHHYQNVLKNKSYQVVNVEGKTEFTGFLIELNKQKRAVYGYVSLFDLFDSLIDDKNSESSRKSCLYHIDQEEIEGQGLSQSVFLNVKENQSYYLMFVAFQKLYDSIQNASSRSKLDELGFRSPGSLLHVTTLVKDSISALNNETDENTFLYHYFLVSEFNRCINCFNDKIGNSFIPLEKVSGEHLIEKLNPGDEDKKFILKLKELYGY